MLYSNSIADNDYLFTLKPSIYSYMLTSWNEGKTVKYTHSLGRDDRLKQLLFRDLEKSSFPLKGIIFP